MKKTGTVIFALCCLLLCLGLSLGTLIFGPAGAGANERLAPLPKLTAKGELNGEYLSQLSAWFGDHFWLRQDCISLRNRLASLTGASPVKDVVLGKEGWLYYAPTLTDYTASEPMTEGELSACARNLALMAEYCEEKGTAFLFVPVPNKNTLYPEHMPTYPAADTHDAQRLLGLLDTVPHVDLFTLFRSQGETLYYAHDSHWTQRGAALGADAILTALGRDSNYFADSFPARARHDGDLYEMLYPAWMDLEHGPVYGGGFTYVREGTDTKPDSITINTTSGGEGTLLCYRDSFGNDLYPYLAEVFAAARFSRSTAYDLTPEAEAVVIELVERNLRYLLTYAPKMPAPRRDLTVPAASLPETDLVLGKPGQLKGCRQLTGRLDSPAERVYLVCPGGVYEACLLEGGFSAWLPEGEVPETVLVQREGTLYAAPANAVE